MFFFTYRESVVKYQMATKEDQFTHLKTFTIFIGTWNVNGQAPPTGPVHEWLACDEEPPDLYAIGFQVGICTYFPVFMKKP